MSIFLIFERTAIPRFLRAFPGFSKVHFCLSGVVFFVYPPRVHKCVPPHPQGNAEYRKTVCEEMGSVPFLSRSRLWWLVRHSAKLQILPASAADCGAGKTIFEKCGAFFSAHEKKGNRSIPTVGTHLYSSLHKKNVGQMLSWHGVGIFSKNETDGEYHPFFFNIFRNGDI